MPKRSMAIFLPCCCYILRINKCVHYKLITARYVLFPQLHCAKEKQRRPESWTWKKDILHCEEGAMQSLTLKRASGKNQGESVTGAINSCADFNICKHAVP